MSLCRTANVNILHDYIMSDIDVFPVPNDQKWRISMLNDLLDEQSAPSNLLTSDEIKMMMDTVCCS